MVAIWRKLRIRTAWNGQIANCLVALARAYYCCNWKVTQLLSFRMDCIIHWILMANYYYLPPICAFSACLRACVRACAFQVVFRFGLACRPKIVSWHHNVYRSCRRRRIYCRHVDTKSNGPQKKRISSSLRAVRNPNWFHYLMPPKWVRVRWAFEQTFCAHRPRSQWLNTNAEWNALVHFYDRFLVSAVRSLRTQCICLDIVFDMFLFQSKYVIIIISRDVRLLFACPFIRIHSITIALNWIGCAFFGFRIYLFAKKKRNLQQRNLCVCACSSCCSISYKIDQFTNGRKEYIENWTLNIAKLTMARLGF